MKARSKAKTVNWKKLALCIALPLAVGGLSALISSAGMEAFERLNQPPLSPPAWLFPVAWTILYILMGAASYLVSEARKAKGEITGALTVYGVQLAFNFLWTIIFFNLSWYLFAFIWLIALWVLILITLIRFYRISKPAGYMLIPYLAWVAFAGYLNFGVYLLN